MGYQRGHQRAPSLTENLILAWADAYHARTGFRPSLNAGPVTDAPGETWAAIDKALRLGCRGLPGGDSLSQLLHRRRPHLPRRVRGWGPGRPDREKRARVAELRARGLSQTEIAARLQVSRQAVSAMLQRIAEA